MLGLGRVPHRIGVAPQRSAGAYLPGTVDRVQLRQQRRVELGEVVDQVDQILLVVGA
ncbi:hypothetical protein ACFLIM_46920 [Nonomuraea sp. M3C6]|uniref:Uncharacterized protein n=1 Tax=Nonomuraea marmarensis TaxID=3351344 RepID=A0ABW7ATG0_9ACTN